MEIRHIQAATQLVSLISLSSSTQMNYIKCPLDLSKIPTLHVYLSREPTTLCQSRESMSVYRCREPMTVYQSKEPMTVSI